MPDRDLNGKLNGKIRKESVMKALTSITKQNIYSFDTRIVETGALIKALTVNSLVMLVLYVSLRILLLLTVSIRM